MFKGLRQLIDCCYHTWVEAYATTEFAERENFLRNVDYFNLQASINDLSAPMHPKYLGINWWESHEHLFEIANTGYEIFCLCEDYHRNVHKPHCDEFMYRAIANDAVQAFGIIANPQDLDNVLHTLLLTTDNLDETDENYDREFATFDKEVAATAITFYYFLRLLFEKDSCGTIYQWITLLVTIVNNNYQQAEMLVTTGYGSGQLKPVPLTYKRNFAFGESPADDWGPTQSEKFHQERRKFLFLTARKDYHFDENLPRQKPNIKYPISFQSNLFYMTA
jgi:hypothetical protein